MKHITLAVLALVGTPAPALATDCKAKETQDWTDSYRNSTLLLPSDRFSRAANMLRGEMMVHTADILMRKGCLDEADELFRLALSRYDDPEFEGIRDQAKVGIDDVRAARRR